MRQVGHPTVVLIRNVEGNFRGRARAVDEQRHAVGSRSAAQHRSGFHHLAHVDLRELSGDGRDGGMNLDVVVEAQEPAAIVRESNGRRATGSEEQPIVEFHQKQYMSAFPRIIA